MRHVSRVVIVAATFMFATTAIAQSIFTIAGGGPIGDGRAATEAILRNPQDAAVDSAGNIYIADTGNHRIRRLDAKSGTITTVAGGGRAASATASSPPKRRS